MQGAPTFASRFVVPGAVRPFIGDHHGAEVIANKLYLFGGLSSDGVQTAVQIFDPTTNEWTTGAAVPYNAGSPSTALIGGLVYVCGGIDDSIGETVDTCAM